MVNGRSCDGNALLRLVSLPEPLCDIQLSLSVIGSRILDRSHLPS